MVRRVLYDVFAVMSAVMSAELSAVLSATIYQKHSHRRQFSRQHSTHYTAVDERRNLREAAKTTPTEVDVSVSNAASFGIRLSSRIPFQA